jgi:hypothetical protein
MRTRLTTGALAVAAVLAGCAPPTIVTIHNGTLAPLVVEGIPGYPRRIEPGMEYRATSVDKALTLIAKDEAGKELERAEVPLAPPGGEGFWAIGGGLCMLEGDYTMYYDAPEGVPASATVHGMMKESERVYVSKGAIAAGPGQRLPERGRRGGVRALVRVPCAATINEGVAASWLEVVLPEIEPVLAEKKGGG